MSIRLMPKFAVQWYHNGDVPGEDPNVEGKIVRYFRHPQYEGFSRCAHCNYSMHEHGFIDRSDAMVVCPGDVLFSFSDLRQTSRDFIDSIGKIRQKTFIEIFGAQQFYIAQKNCQSFIDGSTDETIQMRFMRNAIIPTMLAQYRSRLYVTGSVSEKNIDDHIESEPQNDTLFKAVYDLNEATRSMWRSMLTNPVIAAPEIFCAVWDIPGYKEQSHRLNDFDLKLLMHEDYKTFKQELQNGSQ